MEWITELNNISKYELTKVNRGSTIKLTSKVLISIRSKEITDPVCQLRIPYKPENNTRGRMDFTKSGVWKAVLGGGILIAIASYIYQIYTKEPTEEVRLRPVLRDFCLGASVTASIYMFLPESFDSILAYTETKPSVASAVDIELQTGPARF